MVCELEKKTEFTIDLYASAWSVRREGNFGKARKGIFKIKMFAKSFSKTLWELFDLVI